MFYLIHNSGALEVIQTVKDFHSDCFDKIVDRSIVFVKNCSDSFTSRPQYFLIVDVCLSRAALVQIVDTLLKLLKLVDHFTDILLRLDVSGSNLRQNDALLEALNVEIVI